MQHPVEEHDKALAAMRSGRFHGHLLAILASAVAIGCSPQSALQKAIEEGDLVRLQDALSKGASPRQSFDVPDRLPLHLAAERDCLPCAKLLLQRGAEIGATTQRGALTALYFAVVRGHESMIRFLLANGANPNDVYRVMDGALDMCDAGFIHSPCYYSSTPIIEAVKTRNVGVFRLLLAAGSHVGVIIQPRYAVELGDFLRWARNGESDMGGRPALHRSLLDVARASKSKQLEDLIAHLGVKPGPTYADVMTQGLMPAIVAVAAVVDHCQKQGGCTQGSSESAGTAAATPRSAVAAPPSGVRRAGSSLYGSCSAKDGGKCLAGVQRISSLHVFTASSRSASYPKDGHYRIEFPVDLDDRVTLYCDGKEVGRPLVKGETRFDVQCR